MAIAQNMLEEFKVEAAKTRKFLERVPEGDFDWKPHTKSMSLGQLSSHLAEIPGWGGSIFGVSEFNLEMDKYKPWVPTSRAELLNKFDENVESMSWALSTQTDADMAEMWTMKMNGELRFTMPRVVVMRNFILNHSVHHRAQLGVYLRLKDIPLPMAYGPTADEK